MNLANLPQADYKYFQTLFGDENRKAVLRQIKQTLKQAKQSNQAPPSEGTMEFKVAALRKKQM